MRIILILLFSLISMTAVSENILVNTEVDTAVFCPEVQDSSQTSEDTDLAKRGCCSWHGGVCGCSGSKAKCCDGTISPSCGCYENLPVG